MNTLGKIFEFGYLIIAIVFGYETFADWDDGGDRYWVYLVMTCLAIFMFFFRRRMRKKREDYFKGNK